MQFRSTLVWTVLFVIACAINGMYTNSRSESDYAYLDPQLEEPMYSQYEPYNSESSYYSNDQSAPLYPMKYAMLNEAEGTECEPDVHTTNASPIASTECETEPTVETTTCKEMAKTECPTEKTESPPKAEHASLEKDQTSHKEQTIAPSNAGKVTANGPNVADTSQEKGKSDSSATAVPATTPSSTPSPNSSSASMSTASSPVNPSTQSASGSNTDTETKSKELNKLVQHLYIAQARVQLEAGEIKKAQNVANAAQQQLEEAANHVRSITAALQNAQQEVASAAIRAQTAQLQLAAHDQLLFAARQDVDALSSQMVGLQVSESIAQPHVTFDITGLLEKLKQPLPENEKPTAVPAVCPQQGADSSSSTDANKKPKTYRSINYDDLYYD